MMFDRFCYTVAALLALFALLCFGIQLMFALDKVYHFLPI